VDVGDEGRLTGEEVEGVVELDGEVEDVVVGRVPVDVLEVPVGTAGGVSGALVVVVLELAEPVASVVTGAVVVVVDGVVPDDSSAAVVVVVVPVVDVVVDAMVVVVAGTMPDVVVTVVVVVTDGGRVVAAPAEAVGVASTTRPNATMMAPGNTVASRATRLLELCEDRGIQALTFGFRDGRTSQPPRQMIALQSVSLPF
jgi:hypothetical protein